MTSSMYRSWSESTIRCWRGPCHVVTNESYRVGLDLSFLVGVVEQTVDFFEMLSKHKIIQALKL